MLQLPLGMPIDCIPVAAPAAVSAPDTGHPLPCAAADKERQKAIIIGRGGSALKQLGTAARAEIEEFLGRPVFLSLSVKVRARA